MSKAWLLDSESRLKPSALNASSASGGARNPRPSLTLWPGSATAPSKFVNTTSPFSSPAMTGTALGAVARRSERSID
jgi:hypothetical protein